MYILDVIYNWQKNIEWTIKRRYIYSSMTDEISDMYYAIRHIYPTRTRAIYENYLFWDEFKHKIDEYIYGYGFKEFKKLRRYENDLYRLIDAKYGL